jgi:RHS repeat-associated protein
LQTNGIDKKYLYLDHLGSVDAITDGIGKVTHSMSFDAWGARRSGEDWSVQSVAQILSSLRISDFFTQPITTRGYTGHEMVDDMGIIHMNGRIYDARIGRFLQADPFIDGVRNTQGYNRYSYVQNNPLNATDPSGFSAWTKFRDKWLKPIVAVVLTVVTYGAASAYLGLTSLACSASGYVAIGALSGAAAGFVGGAAMAAMNGASFKDSMKSGFKGAASGALFGGVTGFYGDTWNTGRVLANGIAGGASSDMNGGSFKEGFRLSVALSVVRLYYNKIMKYDVTWKGGEYTTKDGLYDEAYGVPEYQQVFGTNDQKLIGNFWKDFWKQGGALSNAANKVPGMNSLARLHDQYQIGFGSPDGWMRTWLNVPAMIPATLASYGALIETIPAYSVLFDNDRDSQRRNN